MAKEAIGKKMYLLTRQAGQYANMLVISAHGGISEKKQPTFNNKYGTLHFYSVHGHVTDDLGIRNFIFGGKASQLVESIVADRPCFDYSLSKYQGKHAGTPGKPAETYESIEEAQDYVDDYNQMLLDAGDRAPRGARPAVDFDVLTIRNRWWSGDVTLKTALEAVAQVNRYPDIHCYFCRSYM